MTLPSPQDPFYRPWEDPERAYAADEPVRSHSGPAGEVEKVVLGAGRLVDRAQARFTPVAFGYAVFKKYADDEGSRLAALLAYYTLFSIFPLAIGGYAVLRTVAENNPDYINALVTQIVPAQFQQQIIDSYDTLPGSFPALVVALLGLLMAGTGAAFAMYAMVNQVFCVPYRFRFGFGPRYIRVLLMLLVLGVGVITIAGTSLWISQNLPGSWQGFVQAIIRFFVISGSLFAAPKLLSRRPIRSREILIGAVIGAIVISLILQLAGVIVGRFLANSSAVYGAMTTVIAFVSVLFLASNAIAMSYEVSVVWAWRLWPRGVDINNLFPADERAYALLTLMDERMPSQRNGIYFDATGHDDPRRPDLEALMRRPEGIPRTPYDGGPDPSPTVEQ